MHTAAAVLPTPCQSDLETLVARMRREIPLTAAMDLHAGTLDAAGLVLRAPLAPNRNDKGCAFGGSLVSLMTLAAWALVELQLRARGWHCEVYVQDSQVDYLTPVWGELHARAQLDAGEDWDAFFTTLAARGKGRLRLRAQIEHAGIVAARLQARFVAKRVEDAR